MPLYTFIIVGILVFIVALLVYKVIKTEKEIEKETGLTWQDIVRSLKDE